MKKTNVAIVGMGVVGSGVARLLLDHGDRTARHAGRTLWLKQVVVRDLKKNRDADLPEGILTDDLMRVTSDPSIEVVAQLIGGIEPARTIMLQLLEAGKNVVTANKALMAEHGPELFDRARQLGRTIAFEGAVAGGIPIVTNIGQCLSANGLISLQGILNGTCNYVLSRMEDTGASYAESVAAAQRLGFAEADPTLDVDGTDTVQKLAILAHLGFGARVKWSDLPCRGIDTLARQDMDYARQLGYRIKLIASAGLTETGIQLAVSPMLVRTGTPLAEVRENYNAVNVVGDAVGPVFFHGQGAGQMPTASAVVADMIDTAVGRTEITFRNLELWSAGAERVRLADPSEAVGRYYLRFQIVNIPGVLGQIAGRLGQQGIPIASVYQHEPGPRAEGGPPSSVPLVVVTGETRERDVAAAVEQIAAMPTISESPERLRILE